MLDFPSYQQSLTITPLLIVGIMVVVLGFVRLRKSEDGGGITFRFVLTVFVGGIVGLAGGFFLIESARSIHRFRAVAIEDVNAIRIVRSEKEYSTNGSVPKSITDAATIRSGLSTLGRCSDFFRNHESFRNGYRLELILRDAPENDAPLFISAYRDSSNRLSGKTVVYPHTDAGRSVNLGEFVCPEFQQWIATSVDPLFASVK